MEVASTQDYKTVTAASQACHGAMLHYDSSVTLSLLVDGLMACRTEEEDSKKGAKASSAKLESQTKITGAEAQKIALGKVPGGTVGLPLV